MIIRVKISKLYSVSLCLIKKNKFIFLNYKNNFSYFQIPASIICIKTKRVLTFLNCETKFFFSLQTWFKRFKRPTRKKLILVGRGLKATFLRTNTFKILKLKLEYSHFNLIFIPPSIKIKIRKNILTFESFNSSRLGSFLERIKILKLPNIYKGKGIRVKYFKQNLKQIKKSK